jgi:hypothetical protein
MLIDFANSSSEVRTNEEFPAFYFGLDDDEAEVGLWVHVASHLFDKLDLLLDAVRCAFDQAVIRPTK